MTAPAPIDIFRVANIVGEGILWDWRRQVLRWTDIQGRHLYRFDWMQAGLQVVDTPERVGSFGLIAGSDRLITAFASGIALYDVDRQSVEWLPRQPALDAGVRFNDGRVDRGGRFWSGTMVEGDRGDASACLYSVDRTGAVKCQVRGIRISNGLCHSPDGERLYLRIRRRVTIFEYELLENRREYWDHAVYSHRRPRAPFRRRSRRRRRLACGVRTGVPGASCVTLPTGGSTVPCGADLPAKLRLFRGAHLDVLCITSAREGLDAAVLHAEPHAGDVFLYRTGVQGLPESEYRP